MKTDQERIILQQHQLQPTKNRIEILNIFLKNHGPLDTQFILDELEKRRIDIDRVTVFRTMNSFVESQLLNKLEFNEGKSRYELTTRNHHHHSICEKCGIVACIEECNLDSIEKKIAKETGFVSCRHRVEFFGLCKNCVE